MACLLVAPPPPAVQSPVRAMTPFRWAVLYLVLSLVFFLAGSAGIGFGVPFIVNGQPDLEKAIILQKPEDTFVQVEGKCTVTSIKECWATTRDGAMPIRIINAPPAPPVNGGTPTCWKTFSARFQQVGDTRVFDAWPEFVPDGERDCGQGCKVSNATRVPSGEFEVRRQYDCWMPLPDKHNVDARWELGNKWGYKLRDPSELSDAAYNRAYHHMSMGGALLLMALASCCCCSLCASRAHSWAKELDGPDAVATVHVKTPIKSRTRDDDDDEAGAELAHGQKCGFDLTQVSKV